jgi:hypothetical protein
MPLTSHPFTTTSAKEVIISGLTVNTGSATFTAGLIGGVSATKEVTISDSAGQDLIVSNVQTGITSTVSASAGTGGILLTATFKQAPSAPGPPAPPSNLVGISVQ